MSTESPPVIVDLFTHGNAVSGPTREAFAAHIPAGALLTNESLKAAASRLAERRKQNRSDADIEQRLLDLRLRQACEGLDECIETLEKLAAQQGGVDTGAALYERAASLEKTFQENLRAIEEKQHPIAQAITNLQLYFDTAGSSGFRTYWLNSSAEQLRNMTLDANRRHPVLDAGQVGADRAPYALVTTLEDTRVSRLRASLIVLGDDLESQPAAHFWASEGQRRKIPIIASVSNARFKEGVTEDTILAVKKDLCGVGDEYAYLGLAANYIVPDRAKGSDTPSASPAFAYAGVLARESRVTAVPATPDEGRIPGRPSLGDMQNRMTFENKAPLIWFVSTTNAGGEYELTHPNSNTYSRVDASGSITDTIAFSYLTRAIQHYLLSNAMGTPTDKDSAKRTGQAIARNLNYLTQGPDAILQNATVDFDDSDVTQTNSGAMQQQHKMNVKFAGSSERFSIELKVVKKAGG